MLKPSEIIERVILNYFDDEEIKEFKTLRRKLSSKQNIPAVKGINKTQLNNKIPASEEYRLSIDLLITYAETRLEQVKFVEMVHHLGEASVWQGEYNTAKEVYGFLLNVLKKETGYESITAYSFLALGEICSKQALWKESTAYIKEAHKMFKKQQDVFGNAKCENLLGTISGDKGNLKKAQQHFETSLSYLNSKENNPLVGMLEINLGILNSIQGNFDEAFTYYKRALIKYEQSEDFKRIAEVRHNLGMLFTQKGEYDSALTELDKSITVSIKAGYLPTLGISYLSKAYIFTLINDYPLAAAFADKAMEISYRINDRLSIADIYKIKGIIERDQKKYRLAENYLQTSYRINEDLENELNLAETAYELGILYIQMKNPKNSRKYLDEALKYYSNINSAQMIAKINNLISQN